MSGKTLQLKIVLDDTNPPIWRRILVQDSMKFHELHLAIQATMGWTNSHLHQFTIGNIKIEDPRQVEEKEYEYVDSRKTRLDKFLNTSRMKFDYLYDFGDCWGHTITVEKILNDNKAKLPFCIDGKMACPPEDCGGIPNYYELLKIVRDKKHPEHKSMKAWIGGYFDPKRFDLKEINSQLRDYHSMEEEK